MGMFNPKDYDLNRDFRQRRMQTVEREQLAQIARTKAPGPAIPLDIALAICQEIRQANARRWYMPAAWRCWRCTHAAREGVEARLNSTQGHCGCTRVAAAYSQTYG